MPKFDDEEQAWSYVRGAFFDKDIPEHELKQHVSQVLAQMHQEGEVPRDAYDGVEYTASFVNQVVARTRRFVQRETGLSGDINRLQREMGLK